MRLWGKVGAEARGKVSWGRGENFVLVHFFWMPGARSNFTHASVSLSAEHGGGRERFCEVGFGYELISKKIGLPTVDFGPREGDPPAVRRCELNCFDP